MSGTLLSTTCQIIEIEQSNWNLTNKNFFQKGCCCFFSSAVPGEVWYITQTRVVLDTYTLQHYTIYRLDPGCTYPDYALLFYSEILSKLTHYAQKIKTQVIDVSYNLQSRALDCPDLHDNVAEQGEQSYMQQATGFYGFSTTATTYCVASHYVLIPNPPYML